MINIKLPSLLEHKSYTWNDIITTSKKGEIYYNTSHVIIVLNSLNHFMFFPNRSTPSGCTDSVFVIAEPIKVTDRVLTDRLYFKYEGNLKIEIE